MNPCTCGHAPEEHPNLSDTRDASGACEECDCLHYDPDPDYDDGSRWDEVAEEDTRR